ncbi:hypothetical protein GCM10007938_06820 [Vibrio zhanjiangensis]|uniref:Metallo-beta-lactamase domain-containing protein n=1 Tax=Vibrio zhanjiangensis TaxID=1046128 RepID=A0ABQ6EWE1_9VIBR|nr:MBL fold metallo-hydrolase [Vibrio zhanjiangensis]GLT16905.1 hypothetical protein GCM10007938_06820 [Vibrio zhanjiangensis]
MNNQKIQHFFHPPSGTISYVVSDSTTRDAIIIDPVADYDEEHGKISFESAQSIIEYVEQHHFHITAILETHIHADHLSGCFHLNKVFQAPIYISDRVREIYENWKDELGLSELYPFDSFLMEGECLTFGHSRLEVIETPGHTPSDLTFKIGDAIFVGDSLFYRGTGRADFPGGSALTMYQSLSKLYQLTDATAVYLCHNYPSQESELVYKTTIGEEKQNNPMMNIRTTQQDFVILRESRDHQLPKPKLLFPSLEYNLTADKPHH